MFEFLPLAAAVAAGVFVATAILAALPAPLSLHDAVFPYVRPAAATLGLRSSSSVALRGRTLTQSVGRFLEGSGDAALARKLRQARVFPGRVDAVALYRSRVVMSAAAAALGAIALAGALRRPPAVGALFVLLGVAVGVSFWRGRLDRAISSRRATMRIELYTVNQLLAMHIRVGAGVVAAVRRVTDRVGGEVAHELREALRLHRNGRPAAETFRRVADGSPEPHARRTYQALAAAEERGSDVARALLALSEDVRDGRREAILRRATKRRAAMLLPVLGLLAPTLILFVAAPLPWLVLRGFG